MSSPMVSICSITYNHAPFIRQCLDGFLMQQCNFPFEIIINDDCSTDGTTEIIREYAEKYPDKIFPIFHEENLYSQGVRGMFQRFVFPKARGKYIALCEGDDYWTDPLKLQKQVDFLESHPDFSMCFHGASIQTEDNMQSSNIYSDLSEREYFIEEIISRKYNIPTASIMTKAQVCQTIPHHPHFKVGDILVHANAFLHGRVMCIKESMSVYRRHGGSWTADFQRKGNYVEHIIPHNIAMLEMYPRQIVYPLISYTKYLYESWLANSIQNNNFTPLRFAFDLAKQLGVQYLYIIAKITLKNYIKRLVLQK